MPRPDLARQVADRVKLIGVTREQLDAACDRSETVTWQRLPLYTDLTLDGEPLQRFLTFKVDVDLDTFAGLYEEFLAGFILTKEYHGQSPYLWVRKKFGVPDERARQLFPTATRGKIYVSPQEMLLVLVVIAALADYTFGGVIEHDFISFTVAVGKYRFGVEGGRPVTNYPSHPAIVARPFCKLGLQHYGRTRATSVEPSKATLLNQLKAWAGLGDGFDLLLEDAGGFLLALNLLRHANHGDAPQVVKMAIKESYDITLRRQALRFAAGFQNSEDPLGDLRRALVPVILTYAEFKDTFGHCRPGQRPSSQRAAEWRAAIDNLAQELEEAA